MADDLKTLRTRINQLDRQLVDLLNERAKTALQIGQAKAETGKAVYDPVREQAVLEEIAALNAGPLSQAAAEAIFRAIITACREIQTR